MVAILQGLHKSCSNASSQLKICEEVMEACRDPGGWDHVGHREELVVGRDMLRR
jgi:hypothetical protein